MKVFFNFLKKLRQKEEDGYVAYYSEGEMNFVICSNEILSKTQERLILNSIANYTILEADFAERFAQEVAKENAMDIFKQSIAMKKAKELAITVKISVTKIKKDWNIRININLINLIS